MLLQGSMHKVVGQVSPRSLLVFEVVNQEAAVRDQAQVWWRT